MVFPISTEAVVLGALDAVLGAAPPLVVAVARVVVVVVPAGGLAVELHAVSAKAAKAAGARANATSLDECSVMQARIVPRFPPVSVARKWLADNQEYPVPQPGTCWSRLVMPSSRPRSQTNGAPL
jgi:hypothetical protein